MAPKTPSSLPLYEINYRKNYISRGIELFILFLLFSLLAYRFLTLKFHGLQWLLALICESWFTFIWILTVSTKWNQVEPKTYPPRLLERTWNFPAVDIFVTTADPVLEPPLITINTVLSLLAVDYPANKLACYVSDDGASIITYYSLVEASKFAKIWIPFCKKYNISLRAPFRYFSGNSSPPQDGSKEFQQDWIRIKDEYKQLCKKIQDASTQEPETCDFAGDFAVFSNIQPKNHPTIIKVILENKEGVADGLPHLVYISREKRPKHPHQFKAGAMNVLTRVSGVMTNAPFMLNVDCDMYANNPQVILHAMCYFLGAKDEIDCGFVQFPQFFYDGLKEDPYGNQLKVLHEYFGRGIGGIQGPFYQGSGCFHRRKVIYGLSPHEKITAGGLKDEYIKKTYGKSEKLSTSIAKTLLEGSHIIEQFNSDSPSSFIDIAHQVGSCGFEYGTAWGQKLGWLYGSVTEDVLTGLFIQSRGWKSAYCLPDPAAFLGCAPTAGPATMIQQKRWATGLFEVLFNTKTFGKDLAKDEQFMVSALAYIEETLICAEIVRLLPSFLSPIVGGIIARTLKSHAVIFNRLLPIAQERCIERDAAKLGQKVPQHADCIQWIMETSPKNAPWTPQRVVHELMAIWFGSVHAVSTTVTFAIHDLCLHPEYVAPLREECKAQYADFERVGTGLPLLDSFIKESARLTPVESQSTRRSALQPFSLKDGTHVNVGDWFCTPVRAIMTNPIDYPEANTFSGFRFADPALVASLETQHASFDVMQKKPTKLTDVDMTFHVWGTGRMACPGRFYASAVMKVILGQVLLNYDCELVDPDAKRLFTWRSTILPKPSAKVVFTQIGEGRE